MSSRAANSASWPETILLHHSPTKDNFPTTHIIPHDNVGTNPTFLIGQRLIPYPPAPPKYPNAIVKPLAANPSRYRVPIAQWPELYRDEEAPAKFEFRVSSDVEESGLGGVVRTICILSVGEESEEAGVEMEVDWVLAQALEVARGRADIQTGIKIVEAKVGMRKSAAIRGDENVVQEHRVVGIRLEGMKELGWVGCVLFREDEEGTVEEKRYFDVLVMVAAAEQRWLEDEMAALRV